MAMSIPLHSALELTLTNPLYAPIYFIGIFFTTQQKKISQSKEKKRKEQETKPEINTKIYAHRSASLSFSTLVALAASLSSSSYL